MPPRTPRPTADVTAVLVSHEGAAWLPEALAALEASTVQPALVRGVDTGSTDGSADLLRAALGDVLVLPPTTGYGQAVAAALEIAPATPWLWLLHDDAAPDPTALEALLAHADDSPSTAMLGPKVRDWTDPRVLVEVGLTTDLAGRRQTGLERREYDQGQHDDVRDVLAVGTAGALVRRDVWDEVGGLDPALPVYRDDLDLGWRINAAGHRVVVVPDATIRHVRAATTGRRSLGAVSGRPAGIDRRHALFVLLAHARGARLLLTLPRLLVACLLRTLGFLLSRQVRAAVDELAALVAVLGRPLRLTAARRDRARTRQVPYAQVRGLLGSRTGRLRARAEALGDWLAGGAAPGADPIGALGDVGPDDELAELAPAGPGLLRRLLLRPAVALTFGLLLLALAAERSLLGGGALFGGRLLPAPPGARDLWATYAASWHPFLVGSPHEAHPMVAVIAMLATLLLGKAWLAVDVLLLASVPLAGAVAYAAAGRLTSNRLLRAWAGAAWALLPVATGAVSYGRIDTAAAQVALPALLVLGIRLLRDPRTGTRRAWGLGLGLAIASALAPLLWPLVTAVLVVGALLLRFPRRLLSAAIVAAVPAVLLLPWLLDAGMTGLLDGPGRRLDPGRLSAAELLLLSPDGARWIAGGLLAAALAALLRPSRGRELAVVWAFALLGYAGAVSLDRTGHWPGPALQLAAAGLLGAALIGADGLGQRLAHRSFGWRQVTAAVLVAAAVLLPLLAGGQWLRRGADDPLQRGVRHVLPAFVRAELALTPGLRALVLRSEHGGVGYDVTSATGGFLGSADTPASPGQQRALDRIVADVLAARGSDAAEALSTRAVRYVALPAGDGASAIAAALDAQPGLTRRAGGDVLLWDVLAPTARLTVLPPPHATAALRGDRGPARDLVQTDPPRPIPAGPEAARTTVGPGRPGRLLVLAEAADPDWRASFDGEPLQPRTAWGWAQAFELPAKGGVITLDRDTTDRKRLRTAQAVVIALVLVLAAPGARKRRGLEIDDSDGTAA